MNKTRHKTRDAERGIGLNTYTDYISVRVVDQLPSYLDGERGLNFLLYALCFILLYSTSRQI